MSKNQINHQTSIIRNQIAQKKKVIIKIECQAVNYRLPCKSKKKNFKKALLRLIKT